MRRGALLAIAVGLLAAPGQASAAFSGGNGRIVFSSAKRLFTVAPDGGAWASVVDTGTAEQAQAAWSPDGTQLAFRYGPSGDSEVAVVGADGSGLRLVTDTPGSSAYASQPAWTPDGRTILFRSNRAGSPDLWAVPAEGGAPRLVVGDAGDDRYPAPAPDGQHLAYRTDTSGQVEIWEAALDGSDQHQVTHAGTFSSAPSWSPSGDRLAFERGSGGTPPTSRSGRCARTGPTSSA